MDLKEAMMNSIELDNNLGFESRPHKELSGAAFRTAVQLGRTATKNDIITAYHLHDNVIAEDYYHKLHMALRMEEYPGKIIDESRSAHAVGMGRILKHRRTKQNKVGNAMNVAIKPFNDIDKAANEVWGYWQLQDLGIETFDPVGIFSDPFTAEPLVLTKKRNDFTSLDRDEWIAGGSVQNDQEERQHHKNLAAVRDIARVMARMHLNGIFHPDGQIKNFAVTNTGVIGVIDTENLFQIDLTQQNPYPYAIKDIEKLMRSLVEKAVTQNIKTDQDKLYSVGLFHKNSNNMTRSKYHDLFLVPYTEQIGQEINLNPAITSVGELLFENLIEHYDSSEKEQWPQCLTGRN